MGVPVLVVSSIRQYGKVKNFSKFRYCSGILLRASVRQCGAACTVFGVVFPPITESSSPTSAPQPYRANGGTAITEIIPWVIHGLFRRAFNHSLNPSTLLEYYALAALGLSPPMPRADAADDSSTPH